MKSCGYQETNKNFVSRWGTKIAGLNGTENGVQLTFEGLYEQE